MRELEHEGASFRDPAGFVFYREGHPCRLVRNAYSETYARLMGSGLYQALTAKGLLVAHAEEPPLGYEDQDAYKILKPEKIPFISYPYEWSFTQLKDAALATLDVQALALEKDLSLKDGSAYNIQFLRGRPVFIDTLSFEPLVEGKPWVAYRAFCQHFLAPLALMSYTDVRLNKLSASFIDGIPLDLAARLLPKRSYLNISLCIHLHLHARFQTRYQDDEKAASGKRLAFSKKAFQNLITSLRDLVSGLRWKPPQTEWGSYYDDIHYQDEALAHKRENVQALLTKIEPGDAWDLGANRGDFSRLAAEAGFQTVSFDIDPVAVEKNYLRCRKAKEARVLPLLLDLTNPSPAIGWDHDERQSFAARGPVTLILALALVHHLVISNNVPWSKLAAFFAAKTRFLILEFMPQDDPMVEKLLATRPDAVEGYRESFFREAFSEQFTILEERPLKASSRTLFLMEVRR